VRSAAAVDSTQGLTAMGAGINVEHGYVHAAATRQGPPVTDMVT